MTEKWFKGKLKQFEHDPVYLEEKALIKREELIIRIAEIIYSNPVAYTEDKAMERAKKILALIKEAGYMKLDDMKGLFFEAQAKKCANCPKNTGALLPE